MFRLCADDYLYNLGARVRRRANDSSNRKAAIGFTDGITIRRARFREKLDIELARLRRAMCRACRHILSAVMAYLSIQRNGDNIRGFIVLNRAIADIKRFLGPGDNFVLIDGNEWDAADAFESRIVRPFIEINGLDWGPPADCECAIEQLEAIRQQGNHYFVIGWPAFWWFDAYPDFVKHLELNSSCLLRNECVAIFRIDRSIAPRRAVAASQMVDG